MSYVMPTPRTAVAHPSFHLAVVDERASAPVGLARLQAAFAPAVLCRDTAERLLDSVQVHALPAGPIDWPMTGHAPAWWLVAQGRIVVGTPCAQGTLVDGRVVESGQWLDVASAWSAPRTTESAACSLPSTLWSLPVDALASGCRIDASLVHAMGGVMANQMRQLSDGRRELASKDVLARVALWLLRQLPATNADHLAFRLREQKQLVARQLVMAQETLSRCLRRLVDQGCIDMKGYQVVIRDLPQLQAIAGVPAG